MKRYQPFFENTIDTLLIESINNRKTKLYIETAKTHSDRTYGLMFRESLDKDSGMLFINETESRQTFGMKNTLIPLSIAYIDSKGFIKEMYDMPVMSENIFPSKFPAKYALEVNQGWFKEHGIGVGSRIILNKI